MIRNTTTAARRNNKMSAQDIDPKLVVKIDDSESECSVKVTSQDGQAAKKKASHSI